MRYLLPAVFLICFSLNAQVINVKTDSNTVKNQDSLIIDSGERDSLKIFRPTISDYQYQTQFSGKKIFDTVFTVDKFYAFSQYNNRDNFGKIQFSNIGSGFQPLVYERNTEQNFELLPQNKSFGILTASDIR